MNIETLPTPPETPHPSPPTYAAPEAPRAPARIYNNNIVINMVHEYPIINPNHQAKQQLIATSTDDMLILSRDRLKEPTQCPICYNIMWRNECVIECSQCRNTVCFKCIELMYIRTQALVSNTFCCPMCRNQYGSDVITLFSDGNSINPNRQLLRMPPPVMIADISGIAHPLPPHVIQPSPPPSNLPPLIIAKVIVAFILVCIPLTIVIVAFIS